MAKFPVELGDPEGMVDALNYVLSGPSGLGQNFSGVSRSQPAWLTANFRPPFTRIPVSSRCLGADTGTTITAYTPTGITAGQFVIGQGIGTGAQVDVTYAPLTTPTLVPLTVANSGPVAGTVNFYSNPPDQLYVAPIALSTAQWIDEYTRKFTFAVPQPTPPFQNGNSVTTTGVSIAGYNERFTGPGVVECTINYVVVKSQTPQASLAAGAGGTVGYFNTIQPPLVGVDPTPVVFRATDCNATASVNSPTDRVFVNAVLDNTITYTATLASDLQYTVAVNRYLAISNNDPVNPEFIYNYQETVAERVYKNTLAIGSGTINYNTAFGNIIDQPDSGYYLYRLEVEFRVVNTGGSAQVYTAELKNRELTAQVVKQ